MPFKILIGFIVVMLPFNGCLARDFFNTGEKILENCRAWNNSMDKKGDLKVQPEEAMRAGMCAGSLYSVIETHNCVIGQKFFKEIVSKKIKQKEVSLFCYPKKNKLGDLVDYVVKKFSYVAVHDPELLKISGERLLLNFLIRDYPCVHSENRK
jgi:hypothetical protein